MTLRRLGKKKAAALALAGKPWPRSSITASRKAPARRNPKRKAKEFARCYHSEERVLWVQQQGCVNCGHTPSENAHSVGGGAGRKAGYKTIVPLCVICHFDLHIHGVETFKRTNDIDLEALARDTERAWQDHLSGESANE